QIFINFKTNPNYFTKYHQPEPDKSNRFCLYCGLKGHLVEKYYYKKGTKFYWCGKLGHIAKHCKEKFKKNRIIVEENYEYESDNYSEHSVPYDFDIYDD
ncbi:23466_t:CDS:1, partial [Entrophospora sp. SA101]